MTNSLTTWKGVSLAGIDFSYPHKVECPSCASDGRDNSGDNLHVYGLDDDGRSLGAYCFSCQFTIPSDEFLEEVSSNSFSGSFDKKGESMISKRDEEKLKEKSLTPEKLAEIHDKTSDELKVKYRGLNANVAKELGVRWEYNTDGSLKAMYFPAYVKDDGELKVTGYKVRELPKSFYSVGYTGKFNLMGGMTSQVADTLILVAGEIELVTATQAMKSVDKYHKSYNIVTSLTGELSTAEDIKQHYDWVNKHKRIIACMDNDSAGEEAFNDIKKVVDNDKLFKANLRHKDLNDYLKSGDGDKIAHDLYWQAVPVEDYGIVGSDQLYEKALERLNQDKIPFPKFLSDLAEHFTDKSMWTGEWMNWISPTSAGKSTVINAWMTDWSLTSPYRQAVMSYEADATSFGVNVASLATSRSVMRIECKEN